MTLSIPRTFSRAYDISRSRKPAGTAASTAFELSTSRSAKDFKSLTITTVVWLCVAFLFSMKLQAAHTFYLMIPMALLYALYAWERLLVKSFWQRFAAVAIACSIIFHAGVALRNFRTTSIYADRDRIVEALEKKDYRVVGERPAGAKY